MHLGDAVMHSLQGRSDEELEKRFGLKREQLPECRAIIDQLKVSICEPHTWK